MLGYYVLYLRNLLMAPLRDEKGQDLVEYALIIVLIAVLITAALIALRGQIESVFTRIATSLSTT